MQQQIFPHYVLEIKTSMVFNSFFANNTILSCFFYFFLIIDLYFLTPVVITQMFNPTAELAIHIGIRNNKVKAEAETQLVILKTKLSKCPM